MIYFVIIIIIVCVLLYQSDKKKKTESSRLILLEEYSRYKDLIENFDKSYQSLSVSPVEKVIYTLNIVNPKYELMLPLIRYKNQINDWFNVIRDLKLLENVIIKNNVKIVSKRFMLIERYGEDIGSRLAIKGTFKGMSEEMLIDSKGEPTNITREGVIDSKVIYKYQNNSSEKIFTFINGELV